MNLIAAVSANWGIGYKNELLFRIPPDLKRFKKLTMGKTIVMGNNTFKSLPGQKPLAGRKNIVLSKNPVLITPPVNDKLNTENFSLPFYAASKEHVVEMLRHEDADEVFIIGGEAVYSLFLNDCKRAFITKVNTTAPADRFMQDLDNSPGWRHVFTSETFYVNGLEYAYCEYVNYLKI